MCFHHMAEIKCRRSGGYKLGTKDPGDVIHGETSAEMKFIKASCTCPLSTANIGDVSSYPEIKTEMRCWCLHFTRVASSSILARTSHISN